LLLVVAVEEVKRLPATHLGLLLVAVVAAVVSNMAPLPLQALEQQ
tara:strand:+ start:1035 stop:1169 length:135 start_codon:yes stop_codon:yes gene_type:complete